MANESPVGAHHHIVPVRIYAATLVVLLILMGLTIVAAAQPWGTLINNVVAMAIATVKACIVIAIFMGFAFSTRLTKMWTLLGFLWVTLAFGIIADFVARGDEPVHGFYNDAGSALRTGNAKNLPPSPGDFGSKLQPGEPKRD